MNGAINDDLAKALGLLFFFWFFYAKPVRLLSWTIRSSTLATKGWWRVWYPVYFFHAELIVFCLLFYFEVIRCLNIVVPLGGVHSWFAATTLFQAQWNSCIRWWIHFFFRFCPMEVYLDAPWFLRGMRAPTDGSPLKAFMTLSSMNSTGSEFVSSVLMLEHWMMVSFRDGLLTELPMELSPTGALRRCVVFPIGNVNEACYCFFSACKCVLRDCQSIWSKVLCWCNDSFFCFSGQWSGTIRDLEWNNASNHAAARVYLLSQCTIVRLRDLPLGDKIKPIIFRRFQIARMASLPCVFRFLIRMCQLETLRFASNVLCVVFCLRCFFVYQFS